MKQTTVTCHSCQHLIDVHEMNRKTLKIRCGVVVNGKRCPCRW